MIEVKSLRLPNGLLLLHHHDKSTQMVAVNILYDVGARDEQPMRTGMAHLFEHLMFGGTANIPNFDTPLQKAGGESNAWTSSDLTNFYDILPAQNIETAFWLESDRMSNMTFSRQSLDVQKGVVVEEFKQRCVNVPYGDLDHILRDTAFTTHPYKWPVIGRNFNDIENVTLDEVQDFFHNHYTPGNAILCVSGNITFEQAAQLTIKWFGNIAHGTTVKRNIPAEPAQQSPRRRQICRSDVPQNIIVKAFHMCGRNDDAFPVCDIISDLLANGNSARFFKNVLLKTDLFSDLDVFLEYPGIHLHKIFPLHPDVLFQINLGILQIAQIHFWRIGNQITKSLFRCSHHECIAVFLDACQSYRKCSLRNMRIFKPAKWCVKILGILQSHGLFGVNLFRYQPIITQSR